MFSFISYFILYLFYFSFKLNIFIEWSFLAINGKENYNKIFEKVEIIEEPLDIHYKHCYPFFFEDEEKKKNFQWEILPELVLKNQSLITHSAMFFFIFLFFI